MNTHPKFWMVYSPSGRAPTMRHASKEAATKEAQRLAKNNPNARFFVLKAIGGFETIVPEPAPIVLTAPNKQAEPEFAEVPF